MTPTQLSTCCQAPTQVVRGYKDDTFLRCSECGYAAEQSYSNLFDMPETLKRQMVTDAVRKSNQMQQMVMMAAEIARLYMQLRDLGHPVKDASEKLAMYRRWVDMAYGKEGNE